MSNDTSQLTLNITGSQRLPFNQDISWRALNDPDILQRCIKGCEHLEKKDAQNYCARFKIKVGPIAKSFSADLFIENAQAPSEYTLKTVFSARFVGRVDAAAHVTLSPEDADTQLNYHSNVIIDGWLVHLGNTIIEAAVARYMKQFFTDFIDAVQSQDEYQK